MKEKMILADEETDDTADASLDSLSDDSINSCGLITCNNASEVDEYRDDVEEGEVMTVCYDDDDDDYYNTHDEKNLGKLKLSASSIILENSIETASLTCDSMNSLNSSMSSPSRCDIEFIPTADDLSTNAINVDSSSANISVSPELLRRRLHALAPSPIHNEFYCREQQSESHYHDEQQEQHRQRLTEASSEHNMTSKKRGFSMRARPTYLIFLLILFPFLVFIVAFRLKPTINADRPLWDSHRTKWEYFFQHKAPKIMRTIESKVASNMYTIRIKASRLDLVMQAIDVHARCPAVWEIQVDWSEIDQYRNEQQLFPDSAQHQNTIKVVPIRKPPTNAVFLINDDILLTCDEVDRAFHEWQADPSRMVGFVPFYHDENVDALQEDSSQFRLQEVGRGNLPYAILSDRAAFVHKLYLTSLQSMPMTTQCQHLALSMIVSKMTSKAPVAVKSNPHELRTVGEVPGTADFAITGQSNNNCHEWASMVGITHLPHEYAFYVGH